MFAKGDEDNDDCVYNHAYNITHNASSGFVRNEIAPIFSSRVGTFTLVRAQSRNLTEIGVSH